jgi:hypothetical protein
MIRKKEDEGCEGFGRKKDEGAGLEKMNDKRDCWRADS